MQGAKAQSGELSQTKKKLSKLILNNLVAKKSINSIVNSQVENQRNLDSIKSHGIRSMDRKIGKILSSQQIKLLDNQSERKGKYLAENREKTQQVQIAKVTQPSSSVPGLKKTQFKYSSQIAKEDDFFQRGDLDRRHYDGASS